MTPLMLAASAGDEAMLTLLLRNSPDSVECVDRTGLAATHWAQLTDHKPSYKKALTRTLPGRLYDDGEQRALSLHLAIAAGHRHLVKTLLAPHFVHCGEGGTSPGILHREGHRLTDTLSCALAPAACAAAHAPWYRPMSGWLLYQAGERQLTQIQIAEVADIMDPGHGDWATTLQTLVACGFDVHARPASWEDDYADRYWLARTNGLVPRPEGAQSYVQAWVKTGAFDVAAVEKLDALCSVASPVSWASETIFDACLHFAADKALDARFSKRPVVLALLRRGVLPRDKDAQQAARLIVRTFGIDQDLWAPLKALDAKVDMVDFRGHSLAHVLALGDDAERSVAGLVFLAQQGLDVHGHAAGALRPVLAAIG